MIITNQQSVLSVGQSHSSTGSFKGSEKFIAAEKANPTPSTEGEISLSDVLPTFIISSGISTLTHLTNFFSPLGEGVQKKLQTALDTVTSSFGIITVFLGISEYKKK